MASILELENLFAPPETSFLSYPNGSIKNLYKLLRVIYTFFSRRTSSEIIIQELPSHQSISFFFIITIRATYQALIECRVDNTTKSCTIKGKVILKDTFNVIRSIEMAKNMCKITMLINLLSSKNAYDIFVQSWNG